MTLTRARVSGLSSEVLLITPRICAVPVAAASRGGVVAGGCEGGAICAPAAPAAHSTATSAVPAVRFASRLKVMEIS
jgi:hypothetical protein